MKHKGIHKVLGVLLTVMLAVGMIPASTLTAFAAHKCPDCEEIIDGSPYCDDCYKCEECVDLCLECGKCENCSPHCEYCSEELGNIICNDCAIEQGLHCPQCSECYGDCGGDYCEECYICAACADICMDDMLCADCAIANGKHCPSCGECGDSYVICEGCGECCIECAGEFCENCNLCSQ